MLNGWVFIFELGGYGLNPINNKIMACELFWVPKKCKLTISD